MTVTGAHVLLHSPDAARVREALRDVLGWKFVESHPGWLIFKLPPGELGVHPSDGSTHSELWLLCDDLDATMAELRERGVQFVGDPTDEEWGVWVRMRLPGGVELPLYEPKHPLATSL